MKLNNIIFIIGYREKIKGIQLKEKKKEREVV